MSYRTYINRHEWLGNHEGPMVILQELKRQGCCFNEDWCTRDNRYDHDDPRYRVKFQIKNLDKLVQATEKAIKELVAHDPDIANFSSSIEFWGDNLTYGMQELRNNTYIFWSVMLLDYIGKDNYTISWVKRKDGRGLRQKYTLKPGAEAIFEAY